MQDLDDAAKDLEPLVGTKNAPATAETVMFLAGGGLTKSCRACHDVYRP